MASGWTNKGKYHVLGLVFQGVTAPTVYYVRLCTSTTPPTADINTASELTQITAGNGYTAGGFSLSRNATDWDTLTEDDTGDLAKVLAKDVAWTASGGPIPASGNGARWAVLTDDNATDGSRLIIAYWDLVADRSVSVGQTLTLQDCELRLTE